MTVDLKLAHFRTPLLEFESSITPKLVVTPGDVITNDTGFMRYFTSINHDLTYVILFQRTWNFY